MNKIEVELSYVIDYDRYTWKDFHELTQDDVNSLVEELQYDFWKAMDYYSEALIANSIKLNGEELLKEKEVFYETHNNY